MKVLSTGFVWLVLVAWAAAQNTDSSSRGFSVPPPYGFGYAAPYIDNRASTAAEGFQRGFADVLRAQGWRNLLNSKAAINYSEARRREIENREKWTKTYFEMRTMNRQYRSAERGPLPTKEDWVRYAQAGAPSRLGTEELDAVTGKITWPMVLKTPEFAQEREQLEKLFAERAAKGMVGMEEYQEIEEVTNQMKEALKKQITDIPPVAYTTAKNFLNSLAYEARFPGS